MLGQNDLTCFVATVVAYDGFNYTVGAASQTNDKRPLFGRRRPV